MHRNEKGFTLMELMVVIVIVAILAAVAVPLYINYVKDAQRTDAKATIGAIITAEQVYYLKSPSFTADSSPTYAGDVATLVGKGFLDGGFQKDVQKRWDVVIVATATGFDITATSSKDATLKVQYTYTQADGGTWKDTP
jgi:type IV pilus assembly protein PilA